MDTQVLINHYYNKLIQIINNLTRRDKPNGLEAKAHQFVKICEEDIR